MFARLLPEEFVVEIGDPRLPASALLEAERALVARAVPKRRDEYAAGRNCARAALARLGIHDFALLAGSAREPIWPEGVIGSITHTDDFCAAAIGPSKRYAGVGIDAEPAEPLTPNVAKRVASDDELTALDGLSSTIVARLVFSAKESFYKCQFYCTRHWLDFADVRIGVQPHGELTATLLVNAGRLAPGFVIRGRWSLEKEQILTAFCLSHATLAMGHG